MRVLPRLVGVLLAMALLLTVSPAAAQETTWVRGVVTTISGSTVTVKVGAQDMAFAVDKATVVIGEGGSTADRQAKAAGKEGAALTDVLKAGESVEVHYAVKGAANYASIIRRGVLGGGQAAPQAAAKAPAEPGKSVSGQVDAVTGNSLTLTASGKQYVFAVDAATLVLGTGFGTMTREKLRAGEKPVLTDFIKPSDLVLVDYKMKGTQMLASEIHMVKRLVK